MKKTLIALAALAATGAFAQSTVTLYGRMDIGYSATTTTADFAGVSAEVRDNGINNAGMVTNKWGMKGSEDLGGGMKANFQLEQSMAVDTGAATGFTRISTLGLSGNFGTVKLGRDYTPLFNIVGASDVFMTTGASTVTLYGDGVRASDSISYTTPNMGGFNASIMLGRNDTGTTLTTATSGMTGLNATYAAGPLMVGLGYGKLESSAGAVNAQTDSTGLVATYNFGVAKLFAGYTRAKTQANTAVNTYTEATETNLGVSVPMGAATLMAGYGRNTQDFTVLGASAGQTGNDLVVGVNYDLSKRTALYVKTGTYNKLDSTNVLVGVKQNTTAFGLLHNF